MLLICSLTSANQPATKQPNLSSPSRGGVASYVEVGRQLVQDRARKLARSILLSIIYCSWKFTRTVCTGKLHINFQECDKVAAIYFEQGNRCFFSLTIISFVCFFPELEHIKINIWRLELRKATWELHAYFCVRVIERKGLLLNAMLRQKSAIGYYDNTNMKYNGSEL